MMPKMMPVQKPERPEGVSVSQQPLVEHASVVQPLEQVPLGRAGRCGVTQPVTLTESD